MLLLNVCPELAGQAVLCKGSPVPFCKRNLCFLWGGVRVRRACSSVCACVVGADVGGPLPVAYLAAVYVHPPPAALPAVWPVAFWEPSSSELPVCPF